MHMMRDGAKLILRETERRHTTGSSIADHIRNLALGPASQRPASHQGGASICADGVFAVTAGAERCKLPLRAGVGREGAQGKKCAQNKNLC